MYKILIIENQGLDYICPVRLSPCRVDIYHSQIFNSGRILCIPAGFKKQNIISHGFLV